MSTHQDARKRPQMPRRGTISRFAASGMGPAVLALAGLLGCYSMEPTPPDWATPADARPEWLRWYGRAEACSGRTGRPAAVHWATVLPLAMDRFFWYDGRMTAGLWIHKDAIYLSAALTGDSVLVMHESLHHILQTGHHTNAWDRCGVRYPILVEIP